MLARSRMIEPFLLDSNINREKLEVGPRFDLTISVTALLVEKYVPKSSNKDGVLKTLHHSLIALFILMNICV